MGASRSAAGSSSCTEDSRSGLCLRLGRHGFVVALEQRVVRQHLRDLGFQLERGQLQQSDRLLQLWGQRQMLTGTQF